MYLIHKITGHGALVDGEAEQPSGEILVRLNDQWFFLADCEEWEPK